MTLRMQDATELRLADRLTTRDMQHICAHLKMAAPHRMTMHFSSDENCSDVTDVLTRLIDSRLPVDAVAEAIDQGAGKKTIADALRKVASRNRSTQKCLPYGSALEEPNYLPLDPHALMQGTIGSTLRVPASHTPSQASAFADALVEETKSTEPTLGELLKKAPRARSFTQVLVGMSDNNLWRKWCESQNLTRGVAAERFMAEMDRQLDSDPDYFVMDAVLRELVKLPKFADMERSKFIETLKATKDDEIGALADAWSEALARTMTQSDEPSEFAKQEHDGRAALRAFFKSNGVFRGKNADSRLDAALDKLTTDDVGVYDPEDLRCMSFADLKALNVFNVNEARKVEAAARKGVYSCQ